MSSSYKQSYFRHSFIGRKFHLQILYWLLFLSRAGIAAIPRYQLRSGHGDHMNMETPLSEFGHQSAVALLAFMPLDWTFYILSSLFPCFEYHALIFSRWCRIDIINSYCESEGIESATMFAHTLVHCNISETGYRSQNRLG